MPNGLRRIFRFFNRCFMVPMFRLGMGPFFGNPFSGYIMVIKTLGRKSGKTRYSPVNFAILNGCVYCVAGFGRASDWYRNLSAAPRVDLILPGGGVSGVCETVSDPVEQRLALRQILKNAGFAGFFEGFNPFTVSDDELLRKAGNLPVVRIRPNGLANGPSDPGGWAWISVLLIIIILLVLILTAALPH
jgi:deazaflavin-dependent oxidoreductase (nitroreductase family)